MGLFIRSIIRDTNEVWVAPHQWAEDDDAYPYDPFHNDTQIIAIVKKLNLSLTAPTKIIPEWSVWQQKQEINLRYENPYGIVYMNINLNRAIVECASKTI